MGTTTWCGTGSVEPSPQRSRCPLSRDAGEGSLVLAEAVRGGLTATTAPLAGGWAAGRSLALAVRGVRGDAHYGLEPPPRVALPESSRAARSNPVHVGSQIQPPSSHWSEAAHRRGRVLGGEAAAKIRQLFGRRRRHRFGPASMITTSSPSPGGSPPPGLRMFSSAASGRFHRSRGTFEPTPQTESNAAAIWNAVPIQ